MSRKVPAMGLPERVSASTSNPLPPPASHMKGKRDNPEQRLQIAVAEYLRLALKPPTIWTAFPAGGGGKVRGAFLKAMGLQAGWPDILVVHKFTLGDFDEFTLLLGVELKAGKGSQSPAQKAVMDSFRALDMGYEVCRSVWDVQLALAHAGIPLYATVARAA